MRKFLIAWVLATPILLAPITQAFTPKDIVGNSHEKSIQNLLDKWIVKGYEDWLFKPNKSVSFAEAMAIIFKTWEFKDEIRKSNGSEHWSTPLLEFYEEKFKQNEIDFWKHNLNKPITRDFALYLIMKNSNYHLADKKLENYFPDVNENSEFAHYINLAKELWFVGWYWNWKFWVNSPLTRWELATMVNKILISSKISHTEEKQEKTSLKEMQKRDEIRVSRLDYLNKVISLNFLNEYYAFPLAAQWQDYKDFVDASWVNFEEWMFFTNFDVACSNNLPKNNAPERNYIFKWFWKYFVNLTWDKKADYEKFMKEIGWDVDNISEAGWIIYKWTYSEKEWFRFQLAIPLETSNNYYAKNDNWILWDRYYEIWNLVWTEDEIKWSELNCAVENWTWKLPYEIKRWVDL